MSLISLTGSFCIPHLISRPATAAPSVQISVNIMNTADEAAGAVFVAPKTGSIDRVMFKTATVTTGTTVDVRLETVDPATGMPTGTLWGVNTNASQVIAAADDNVAFEVTLTAAASVTLGDKVALVIRNPSASFGSWVFAGQGILTGANTAGNCYGVINAAGSWAKDLNGPCMAVRYSDTTYPEIFGAFPPGDGQIVTNTYGNATSPNVRGLRFQLPFRCRFAGCWINADIDGDCDVRLVSTAYNKGAGTGILSTIALDKDIRATTVIDWLMLPMPQVTLEPNQYYRLVIEPNTATSLIMYDAPFKSLAIMDAWSGGRLFHFTTANDPTGDGDWTNYNSGTFRRPLMGVIIDAVDTLGVNANGQTAWAGIG